LCGVDSEGARDSGVFGSSQNQLDLSFGEEREESELLNQNPNKGSTEELN
jgi:hypothetical protein